MSKPKKKTKSVIVIILGIVVLISVIGGFILFSTASPFAPKYNLSIIVKDAYGAIEGATVNIGGFGTYVTNSAGSIESILIAKGTYSITVMAQGYETKIKTIDLASDMNLVIEVDYVHQYLTIISPTNGYSIPSNCAEYDPVGMTDIVIWVKGTYAPGRTQGNYIKTFIDEDSHCALTSVSFMWDARVYVGHVSAGRHILYVQYISGSDVIEQQSIEIVIPAEWHVYFSTVGLADTGDGISRNPSEYPYWLGMNPPFPGQVIRIFGEFYLDILDNEPCQVWVDLWDPGTKRWVIVEKILDTRSGWNTFDVGVDYVTTNWWGLAGCHCRDDETEAYNKVTEFKGEVWMVAGTHYYNTASINILDWINNQFFPSRDEDTAGPASCVSDDNGILMSIDPTDLYVYAGSTPIAWVICLVISSILLLGVTIFFMHRRKMI